jgi:hypothetical protein
MPLSNEVSTSQFADAVANCGTDPLAQKIHFHEKFEMIQKIFAFFAFFCGYSF